MIKLRIFSILLSIPIILSSFFGSFSVGFIFFHYIFSLKGIRNSPQVQIYKETENKFLDPKILFVFFTLILGILSVKFLNFQIFLYVTSIIHIAFSDVFFTERKTEKRSKKFVFFQSLFSVCSFYLICRFTDHNINFETSAQNLMMLSIFGMILTSKRDHNHYIHFANEIILLLMVLFSYIYPNQFNNVGVIHISLYHAWTWFIFAVIPKDRPIHKAEDINWMLLVMMTLATLIGFGMHYFFVKYNPESKIFFQQTLQAFGISHILSTFLISNRNPVILKKLSDKIFNLSYFSRSKLNTQS